MTKKNQAATPSANAGDIETPRLGVMKTYKLFIAGAFPRSESGRSFEIYDASGHFVANAAHASRKDLRDAVLAARGALAKWSSATSYNRGQILYRFAEMLDARRQEIEELLSTSYADAPRTDFDACVDRVIWYAGVCDKLTQLLSSVNPVAGPFLNLSAPTPVGVTFSAPGTTDPLLELLDALLAPLAAGATTVLVAPEASSALASTLAEALAVSDLPGGVVNILTGHADELLPVASSHEDIDLLDLSGVRPDLLAASRNAAAESLKRVARHDQTTPALARLRSFTETRTTWHSIGV